MIHHSEAMIEVVVRVYMLIGMLFAGVGAGIGAWKLEKRIGAFWGPLTGTVAGALIGFLVINGFSALASTETRAPLVTTIELGHAFGLESGKAYPVVAGHPTAPGTIGVSVVNGSYQLNLRSNDHVITVTIPKDAIVKDVRPNAANQLTLNLADGIVYGPDNRITSKSSCDWGFSAGVWWCKRTTTYELVIVAGGPNPTVSYLSEAVRDNLRSATLTVTPQMYSQLERGKNG